MTAQRSTVNPVLEPLIAVHREVYPKADLAILQRAYEVAEAKHATQLRRSGDPYITHPLAVANILAELGMDTITLVAALLHDTVEDTGYTLEALTADFGDEVGHLVDGVTKLDKVVLGSAAEGETIRKMIIAMARDPRVLVIKVADRLHNMRTMRFLPPEKQARRPARPWKSLHPLRIGWAWRPSSGSSRTCRSRSCIPSGTRRSCAWWPTGHRRATPTWRRCAPRSTPR
jgi:GTP pyrophosphokinase